MSKTTVTITIQVEDEDGPKGNKHHIQEIDGRALVLIAGLLEQDPNDVGALSAEALTFAGLEDLDEDTKREIRGVGAGFFLAWRRLVVPQMRRPGGRHE